MIVSFLSCASNINSDFPNNELNCILGFDFVKGDIEKYILSFDVSKKLNKKYVIKLGSRFDLNNQSISPVSFISLFYLL